MTRQHAVHQNLRLAHPNIMKMKETDRNFIIRFWSEDWEDKDAPIYYERPSMFGSKTVDMDELTVKEFNKLHRIVNPHWAGQKGIPE